MALHIFPIHRDNRCFPCLCSIADTHTMLIEPHRHRISIDFKAFSGLSVLIFQKIYHLLGISALGILCKNSLSAVLFSSATAKNGFKLILRQRKSSGHGIFHTCFRCCDCSDLLLKRRKQAKLCKCGFRCVSPERCICYRLYTSSLNTTSSALL